MGSQCFNCDEVFVKNEATIFEQIQEISDNESEKSFSDLINDYDSNRRKTDTLAAGKKHQISTSDDDDSFEKIDMEDVLHPNRKNVMDEPLKPCEGEDLFAKSHVSHNIVSDNGDLAKQKYTKKKQKGIDKACDKRETVKVERSLSQVSSIDVEEFDDSLVLPKEKVVKWAVQLLLALEKLHTIGVVCRYVIV